MFKINTIYFDGRSLAEAQPKGVARYASEMLKCLSDLNFNVVVISNKPYNNIPVESGKIKYEYYKSCRFIPGFIFVLFILPFILFGKKKSIFWGVNHTVPVFGIKTIVSIHDLVAFRFTSTMTLYNAIATKLSIIASLYFANVISTVSIKTKNELQTSKLVNENENIYVITNIVDVELFNRKKELEKREKIILILGSIEPRKNIVNALQAFDHLCEKDRNWRLLVVGGKTWGSNEVFQRIEKSNFKDNISLIDHIDDNGLTELYKSVALLLFPSYDEGFGLPVFEAISSGCPVLATAKCELKYYLHENFTQYLFDPEKMNLNEFLVEGVNNIENYIFDIDMPVKNKATAQIQTVLNLMSEIKK
jgi:glycosyltransferase involved in cell wall biosynthesis